MYPLQTLLYTFTYILKCKSRKTFWFRNALTPIFLRFNINTTGIEWDTYQRKRLRAYLPKDLWLRKDEDGVFSNIIIAEIMGFRII